jgi:uncharacterized DUF497 family protein
MDPIKKLAREWQVTERWIRETLDDLALDVVDLRVLGKDAVEVISFRPIERQEHSLWDGPDEPENDALDDWDW